VLAAQLRSGVRVERVRRVILGARRGAAFAPSNTSLVLIAMHMAPVRAAAFATLLAPRAFTANAASGSRSQRAVSVSAAQCTTASGRCASNAALTASAADTSSVSWPSAITSCAASARCRSRPSWPLAPVMRIRIRAQVYRGGRRHS
jgi:hypothetical protein